jgi:5'-3' exonuclease
MRRIIYQTGCEAYKAFIGGSENFRYKIDPNYKANRKDVPRPAWLQQVREHLVMQWDAKITDGIEADDALGIEQCSGDDTVIVTIDKDLLQVPGRHYNFVTEEWQFVSPLQGSANFYTQLIMGDRSDNIQGYDGKMRQTVPNFLRRYVDDVHQAASEREMYEIVESIYELGDEALLRNGNLLYIQRKENDTWEVPE